MPQQISLEGFEPPVVTRPTDRLFFAIFPDPDTAARIAALALRLRASLGLKGKPLAAQRLHITLHHVGDFAGLPHDIVAKATIAGSMMAFAPFEVAFDRVMSFSGRTTQRPFVLRDGDDLALATCKQTLLRALANVGLVAKAKTAFTAHVTLLYDDRLIAEQAVERIQWTAHELVLVHSLLGQTVHVPLARWPLRPQQRAPE